MKIVHIIDSLNPAHGGPSVSSPSLAAAQSELGHDVSIVCQLDNGAIGGNDTAGINIPNFSSVQLHRIPKSGILDDFFAATAAKKLKDVVHQCDIMHLHGIWDPILLRAAKIGLKFEKDFVFAPRGTLHPWSLAQKRWKKQIVLNFILKRVLAKSAFIHALNEAEAHFVGSLGLKTPVKIFPNGIFPDQYRSRLDPDLFYRAVPWLGHRRYILFLGRLHYSKGLEFAAGAFAKLAHEIKDVDLVVAGPDEGSKGKFEEKVKYHNLCDRVHVIGPLYGEQKYAALQEAICFLLPSRQEGFSVAILEAMASGLPVVVSEKCNFPEIAEYGAGEIVPLGEDAVKGALYGIVSNPDCRAKMSRAARDLAFSKFSWHSIAEAVISGYTEVLG
jgi:glycosyltransferase involved in cell wall biosynthesis